MGAEGPCVLAKPPLFVMGCHRVRRCWRWRSAGMTSHIRCSVGYPLRVESLRELDGWPLHLPLKGDDPAGRTAPRTCAAMKSKQKVNRGFLVPRYFRGAPLTRTPRPGRPVHVGGWVVTVTTLAEDAPDSSSASTSAARASTPMTARRCPQCRERKACLSNPAKMRVQTAAAGLV
jgi:hypothetical protein